MTRLEHKLLVDVTSFTGFITFIAGITLFVAPFMSDDYSWIEWLAVDLAGAIFFFTGIGFMVQASKVRHNG